MTFAFPSHYLPPPRNSGHCNSFYCLGHFNNVSDDDDDDDDDEYCVCAPRGRRQSPPYLMENVKPRDDGLAREGNDRYEGYCVDLADEISAGPIQRRVSRSFSAFVNPPAATPARPRLRGPDSTARTPRPRTPRPRTPRPGLHGPGLHGPGLHGPDSAAPDSTARDRAELTNDLTTWPRRCSRTSCVCRIGCRSSATASTAARRLQTVRDGKYGGKTATGEWNGMIGELTNRVRRKMRRGTRPAPGFCRGGIHWKKS